MALALSPEPPTLVVWTVMVAVTLSCEPFTVNTALTLTPEPFPLVVGSVMVPAPLGCPALHSTPPVRSVAPDT